MHGSLKDYLKSVKTGVLPNPQLLLYQQQYVGQAPPIATPSITVTTNPSVANGNTPGQGASASGMISSVYPATNRKSMLSLCPYHYNQLTQHNHNHNGATPYMSSSAPTGGTPGDQHYHHLYPAAGAQAAAQESVSLGNTDPASKAHAMRLLRLLNSEYGLQQLADNHKCCHDDMEGDEAAIKLGQSAYSYSGLSEMCVRRACLDDYPYWYHGTMPRNDYYNSYYNYNSEHEKKEDSESPFADTPGTNAPLLPPPPIYINACEGEGGANSSSGPQQECLCHHLSATNLNPYHSYNLSTASGGCVYCCQCAAIGEAVGGGGGVYQQTGADQSNPGGGGGGGGANVTPDNTETRLSYFEVLDFALQIAQGMEHLEKMKVSFAYRHLCWSPTLPYTNVHVCINNTIIIIILW